jgi:hypothetical protein
LKDFALPYCFIVVSKQNQMLSGGELPTSAIPDSASNKGQAAIGLIGRFYQLRSKQQALSLTGIDHWRH